MSLKIDYIKVKGYESSIHSSIEISKHVPVLGAVGKIAQEINIVENLSDHQLCQITNRSKAILLESKRIVNRLI